jgi:hypothetical protein
LVFRICSEEKVTLLWLYYQDWHSLMTALTRKRIISGVSLGWDPQGAKRKGNFQKLSSLSCSTAVLSYLWSRFLQGSITCG